MRGICAAIAAMMMLVGCGSEPAPRTVTVTESAPPVAAPTSKPPSVLEWRRSAADAVEGLGDALIAVGDAMQDYDLGAMRARCTDLRAATDVLERELPSPDEQVTAAFQDGIDNFRSASQLCMTLSPMSSQTEMAQMDTYIDTGGARMCDGYELLGLDTGCRD